MINLEYTGYERFVTEYETKLPFFVATVGITEYETTVLRPSGIEDYQLIFTKEGCGVIEINGNEKEMPENSFIIIPPLVPHHYRAVTEKWSTYWITYNGFAAERFFDFSPSIFSLPQPQKFLNDFNRLLNYQNDKEYTNESSCILYEILINLKFHISENPVSYKQTAKK